MDLIDEFMALTASAPTSKPFRLWAGIFLTSAGLGKRTYTAPGSGRIYPNLYLFLIGPPGTGKSVAIKWVQDLVKDSLGDDMMPDRMTARDVTRRMGLRTSKSEEGKKEVDIHGPATPETKAISMIHEWIAYFDPRDDKMAGVLSDLWDCPDEYWYSTAHSGEDRIIGAYLAMIAAVQPMWFRKAPVELFGQGLMARMLYVYDDETFDERPMFVEVDRDEQIRRENLILSRFQQLQGSEGAFYWYPKAQERLNELKRSGCLPKPEMPILADYNVRRPHQLVKLAMISGASRTGQLVVAVEDVERALEWLLEAEKDLPKALSQAATSQYYPVEQAAVAWVRQECERSGKSLPEASLRRRLARDVPPHMVPGLIDGLVAQGYLNETGESPRRSFLPGKAADA